MQNYNIEAMKQQALAMKYTPQQQQQIQASQQQAMAMQQRYMQQQQFQPMPQQQQFQQQMPQQPFQQQPPQQFQQQPTPTGIDPNVNGIKTVTLQNGSVIQRQLNCMIFKSTTGGTMQMTPPPKYQHVSSDTPKFEYKSKTGDATKLGYEKHFGKPSWKKNRHLVLEGIHLNYYKKISDPHPKGVINLISGSWVIAADKDTPRRKDAFSFSSTHGMGQMLTQPVGQMFNATEGTVERDNCIEVHQPANLNNTLDTLLNATPLSIPFGGTSKKLQKNTARTYYFQFQSDSERKDWLAAVQNNMKAYVTSEDCFKSTKAEFIKYLQRCGGASADVEQWDWFKILEQLYF